MMDDDKKIPEGIDNSFEEHELDLNTPEDLNPIDDTTFADTKVESMSIFDEFDDSDDFADFAEPPAEPPAEPTTGMQDPAFEIPAFDEHDFDEPAFEEPAFAESATQENLVTDEDMFTSDAFEDVNSDFPEGDPSQGLGDSQLFDYDPSAASTEEEISGEDIYGGAASASMDNKPSKGSKNSGGGGFLKNRRTVRIIVLLVLVGAVYGVLRLFTGGNANTMTNVAAPTGLQHPAPVPMTAAPEPEHQTAEPAPAPEVAVAPETTPASEAAPTPEAVPATASTTTTTTTTTAVPDVSALNQQPQTSLTVTTPPSMNVPTPTTVVTTNTTNSTSTPPDQIAHKLDTLEASIAAIDNRLATISSNNSTTTVVKGAIPAGQGNAFGSGAPESQEILMKTLSKIEGIDKKMSYISDLETQVHILNKEVNALKNDVVQQSIIVGQNQAHINQNLIATIDANAPKMIVQAAIPGRAWLRSESGQLITVIPGDEVAGYGRVVSIDPTTGTVLMSSRAVFREQ